MSGIPDDLLATLILGIYKGITEQEGFPIRVGEIVDNMNEKGVESFTIVTGSGLRYTVRVDLEEGK